MSDAFDFNSILSSAMELQQRYEEARAEAAEAEVVGSAGGGAVKITITGGMVLRGVQLDPKAVDPENTEMLEDLILAAFNDAIAQIDQIQQELMGEFVQPNLSEMDFSAMLTMESEEDK
ncbi:MAG: hypothetical protein RLZZ31_1200 [Actinomycetota bacterium]